MDSRNRCPNCRSHKQRNDRLCFECEEIECAIEARISAAVADLKAENDCLRILACTDGKGDYMPLDRREAVAAREVAKCREIAKRSDDFIKGLQETVSAAVAEEREACSKLAESCGQSWDFKGSISDAIRARGAK